MSSEKRDIGIQLQQRVVPAGGTRHGLVIGIQTYHDTRLNLRCACKDAQAMHALMTDPACGLFPPENVTLLVNEHATTRAVRQALSSLARKAGEGDTVWVYYAGHGAQEGDDSYWVTHDADVNDLYGTGVRNAEIADALSRIVAGRVVVFLDCCHAAATAVQRNTRRKALSPEAVFAAFSGTGKLTISSSNGQEQSVELSDKGHGAFTYFLTHGLHGEADLDQNGVVTADELWHYLQGKVRDASREAGNPQTPIFKGEMSHDLALTLNPAMSARIMEITAAIESKCGLGQDKLTTGEAEFCIDLLSRTPRTAAERSVTDEFDGLLRGTIRLQTFKALVKSAMQGISSSTHAPAPLAPAPVTQTLPTHMTDGPPAEPASPSATIVSNRAPADIPILPEIYRRMTVSFRASAQSLKQAIATGYRKTLSFWQHRFAMSFFLAFAGYVVLLVGLSAALPERFHQHLLPFLTWQNGRIPDLIVPLSLRSWIATVLGCVLYVSSIVVLLGTCLKALTAKPNQPRKVVDWTKLVVPIAISWCAILLTYSAVLTRPSDMYNVGRNCQVNGNYVQAMSWYRQAVDAGNISATNEIGVLYDNGQGVPQDFQQAMNWYRKAADAGDADAMTNIGVLYDIGHGVGQDYQQAMNWYRKAADAGDGRAMRCMGVLYDKGHGVGRDDQQAMLWYHKAADAGDLVAPNYIKQHDEAAKARNAAETAQKKAQQDGATNEINEWSEAQKHMTLADNAFKAGEMPQATAEWQQATSHFTKAGTLAQSVLHDRDLAEADKTKVDTAQKAAEAAHASELVPAVWKEATDANKEATAAMSDRKYNFAASKWRECAAAYAQAESQAQAVAKEQQRQKAIEAKNAAQAAAQKAEQDHVKDEPEASPELTEAKKHLDAADKLFNADKFPEAVKDWQEASSHFATAGTQAQNVKQARAAEDAAGKAKTAAEKAHASALVSDAWKKAVDACHAADDAISKRQYPDAAAAWQKIADAYKQAESQANDVVEKAKKGDIPAMLAVGSACENDAVSPDYAQAMVWYRAAADLGNPHAMFRLGMLYYNGRGVKADQKQASDWCKKAADGGDSDAKAWIIAHPREPDIPADPSKPGAEEAREAAESAAVKAKGDGAADETEASRDWDDAQKHMRDAGELFKIGKFSEAKREWHLASSSFASAGQCAIIVRRDRHMAEEAMAKANLARKEAEEANAKKDVPTLWQEAIDASNAAIVAMSERHFQLAASKWDDSAKVYKKAIKLIQDEKQAQSDLDAAIARVGGLPTIKLAAPKLYDVLQTKLTKADKSKVDKSPDAAERLKLYQEALQLCPDIETAIKKWRDSLQTVKAKTIIGQVQPYTSKCDDSANIILWEGVVVTYDDGSFHDPCSVDYSRCTVTAIDFDTKSHNYVIKIDPSEPKSQFHGLWTADKDKVNEILSALENLGTKVDREKLNWLPH